MVTSPDMELGAVPGIPWGEPMSYGWLRALDGWARPWLVFTLLVQMIMVRWDLSHSDRLEFCIAQFLDE